MSRFLLLLLFLIWMAWRSEDQAPAPAAGIDLALFFGMYALMVVMLGMWSRLLAQRVGSMTLRCSLRYFNRVMFAAQVFIPVWFAVGVFFLGWGVTVQRMLGGITSWPVQTPGAIIGTIPALLAWMGLWWSQYPADRALREQNLLVRFDQDLPVYASPTLREYARQSFRLQILFSAVPILMILLVHDLLTVTLWKGFGRNIEGTALEGLVTFCSAISVFIIVPAILYRILGARTLPPSALRDRMEAMCRLHGVSFRNILLWPTHNRVANALVMGVAPRFRYVLLSDLLLAEMSDEQIEAVFAHELGHVAHRHMIWYLVFMKVLILVLAVVALFLEAVQRNWLKLPAFLPMDLMITLIGFGGFLFAFGFISRRFERQADVFAARTLERSYAPPRQSQTHVGPLGATIFASALERVALINNMPLGSQRRFEGGAMQRLGWLVERFADLGNNWLHGSISTRMHALHHMSRDPARTHNFDRRMARLYVTLVVSLLISGTLAWVIKLPI